METQPPTLIRQIDAFLLRHEMKPIAFGRAAMNDPHFVRDLRNGRDLKMSTLERVRSFMAEQDQAIDHAATVTAEVVAAS